MTAIRALKMTAASICMLMITAKVAPVKKNVKQIHIIGLVLSKKQLLK